MNSQLDLFGGPTPPEGFRSLPEFISRDEENYFLKKFQSLTFETFKMHGVEAKRKIVHYGLSYDFLSRSTSKTEPIPDWLEVLRRRVEEEIKEEIVEVLVTNYPSGAGIGWHFDAPSFKSLLGVSLLGPCRFQMRREKDEGWEKYELNLGARDAYVIQGEARWKWQHHIPPVKRDRFSLTFRSLVSP